MGLLRLIENPTLALYVITSLLVAISIHEFLHAWTASYLGDPTAKKMGRVTLNPLAHLDPLGTISLLFLGIGWGKPVQINPNNFKNPRLGSALTAIAGPMSNLILALFLAMLYRLGSYPLFISQFILALVFYNLLLMVFNLVPVPPLDGSKFFALIFPGLDSPKFERVGPYVLIVILLLGGFAFIVPVILFFVRLFGLNPSALSFLFI